ncbi:MAG: 6-bladed beta-propeller [Candidatus Aminicenantes bacterium]
MFHRISALDVDNRGNIYVLDEKAGNVKIFDRSGGFVRTFGIRGQERGETPRPKSIQVTPQGEIVIREMALRSLLFFNRKGKYLREVSVTDKFLFFGPRITARGHIIASHTIAAETPVTKLIKYNSELKQVMTIASIPWMKPPAVSIFTVRNSSDLIWDTSPEDEVIWGDIGEDKYELCVHDTEGKLIKKIVKEYDPVKLTAADRVKLKKEILRENSVWTKWDVKYPPSYPPFSGISVDDEGRIYVKTDRKTDPNKGCTYDIFDAEGHYIAKVLLTNPLMVIKKAYFYTIGKNEDGRQVVKRYQMKWRAREDSNPRPAA